MAEVAQWAAVGALGLSVAAAVAATLATVWMRDVPTRLHYPGIIGSVSGPLLALAVLLDEGPGLTALTVAATMALLAVTGPVLTAAIGKLNAPAAVRPAEDGRGER
ncbi:monovalent cation/H(+) antiporter subunit G [Nocardia miyunensis]|uniref:monovalent cation/H(+) antiporter subunit G n=1 Tax=Nocardia miyunensis TaxID=282684 RepID=UPI0009FF1C9D|nr:monovalent cation/H(+) antiporter subunit G [Nocardia miyunensis]